MEDPNKNRHCCPYEGCTAAFCRPYRLTDHLFAAHTKVRAYVCQEGDCKKSYSNKSHLIRHIKIVHKKLGNNVIYSCPTCMKNYVNKQNLQRHIKLQHSESTSFACDFCRSFFKKKNQLKAHIYQHTGVKSFSCEICQADFITHAEKKKHLRSHKVYECCDCLLKFDVWSKYQRHRKAEHEPKEYFCDGCSRSFKKRAHIVRHVKTHDLNVKPVLFECPYENCYRSYTRNNNLRAHIAVNHMQVKFVCHVCQAELSSKTILNKHLKLHSQNQECKVALESIPHIRQKRKDMGSLKVSTALKLAGYPLYPVCSLEESNQVVPESTTPKT